MSSDEELLPLWLFYRGQWDFLPRDGEVLVVEGEPEEVTTLSGIPIKAVKLSRLSGASRAVAAMEGYDLGYAEGYERRKKDEEILVKSLVKRVRELFGQTVEAEQILGKALGYPRYCDDPNNFPHATPENGVCIGEHTLVTLAEEAAERLGKWRQVPDGVYGEHDTITVMRNGSVVEISSVQGDGSCRHQALIQLPCGMLLVGHVEVPHG